MLSSLRKILRTIDVLAGELRAVAWRTATSRAAATAGPPAMVRQLEDRILLSASPAAILGDGSSIAGSLKDCPAANSTATSTDAGPLTANRTDASADLGACSVQIDSVIVPQADVRRELAFVDPGVNDYERLVADLHREGTTFDVVVLDAAQDGIEQVSAVLAEHTGLDAVHFLSHGTAGAVKLGNTWLTTNNLTAYAGLISGWADSLGSDADLLFYGCDLAGNPKGEELLGSLQALTGADVAASMDDTGHVSLGGDWNLEYSAGSIETAVVVSSQTCDNWQTLLSTFTVTNTNDSGAGSLRQAIIDANALPGLDEIHFNIADDDPGHCYYQDDLTAGTLSSRVTTTLSDGMIGDFDPDYPYAQHSWFQIDLDNALAQLQITDAVIIDGYTQPGATQNTLSVGNNANLRIRLTNSAADSNRGLTVESGGAGSSILGLVINRFGVSGILTEPGADNVTVQGNFIGTDVTGTKDVGNGDAGVHLRSSGNLVGGSNVADRNVISGNDSRGITTYTFGPIETGNVIANNYIGVDATGVGALGNSGMAGVQIFNNDGLQLLDNLIAANTGDGVWLRNSSSVANTVIRGNLIGVGADGTTALGHMGVGIWVEEAAINTTIGGILAGEGNTIANNGSDGIALSSGTGTSIRGNNIFNNGALGIDLLGIDGANSNDAGDSDNGPNTLQNFPILESAAATASDITIVGSLNSTPSSSFALDFYANTTADPSGYGEGETWLGSTVVSTDVNGDAAINLTLPVIVTQGSYITATATTTGATQSTSEFSPQIMEEENVLWFSTASDHNTTGNFGPTTLLKDAAYELGGPNFQVEPTGSDGWLAPKFFLDLFDNGSNLDAIHYVTQDTTIGGVVNKTLEKGDLLFSVDGNFTCPSQPFSASDRDLLRFRPNTAGNYTSGTFELVLADPVGDNLWGATLVESDTVVGGQSLTRGDFLFSRKGGSDHYKVFWYHSDTGISEVLIDGNELGFNNSKIHGLELIDRATTVGGRALSAGTLLVTIESTENVGNNLLTVDRNDVFALVLTSTTLDGGAVANASLLFDGTAIDVNDDINALTVRTPQIAAVAPVITSNGGGATAAINVAENSVAVTTVVANDADMPAQVLTYSIIGGPDAVGFSINGATGELTFNTAPDFESPTDVDTNNVYDVTVQVSDGTLTDAQAIAVTVTALNDNNPIFTSPTTATVAENTTVVMTVVATDADNPAQTRTYSISGGADAASFSINGTTGHLTFNAAPDFESPTDAGTNNVYEVQVTADDGNGGTTAQSISITVTSVNDNNPIFTSPTTINVTENTTAVMTVTATDADSPAQTVIYSISGGADAASFSIDGATGELTFNAAPDFESPTDADTNNVYEVTVQVSDGTLTDSQAIAVTVTALNDNNPIFTSPTTPNVAENTTAVMTVTATDADNPAQTLTYSISGGADAACFSINGTTGTVTFNAAPAFESPTDADTNNVYDVQVTADDGYGGTSAQSIAITVTSVNDNNPIFTSPTMASVAENTTAVMTVAATDNDSPAQMLTYLISGGADAACFSINGATGELTFNATPDFESPTDADTNNIYELQITADDGNGGTTAQSISITVTALNDNNPIFTSPTTASVPENTSAVMTVAATDADSPAQTLTYSISGGADATLFTINPATGRLTFVAPPNFENPADVNADNVHAVSVRVDDGNGGTDTQLISVAVTDVNDTPSSADDGYSIDTNQTLTLVAPGVLVGDADEDGDPLTVSLVSGPAHGTLTLGPDGSFSYTPDADYFGTDTFTYRVDDGNGGMDTATVSIAAVPEAFPPPSPPPADGDVPSEEETPTSETTSQEPAPDNPTDVEVGVPASLTPEATPRSPDRTTVVSPMADEPTEPLQGDDREPDDESLPDFVAPAREEIASRIIQQHLTSDGRDANSPANRAAPTKGSNAFTENHAFLTPSQSGPLWQELDDFHETLESELQFSNVAIGSVGTIVSGFTVGYVLWALRGGLLLSSVLASLPAWTMFDPLVIASVSEPADEDQEESLEQIVETQATLAASRSRQDGNTEPIP